MSTKNSSVKSAQNESNNTVSNVTLIDTLTIALNAAKTVVTEKQTAEKAAQTAYNNAADTAKNAVTKEEKANGLKAANEAKTVLETAKEERVNAQVVYTTALTALQKETNERDLISNLLKGASNESSYYTVTTLKRDESVGKLERGIYLLTTHKVYSFASDITDSTDYTVIRRSIMRVAYICNALKLYERINSVKSTLSVATANMVVVDNKGVALIDTRRLSKEIKFSLLLTNKEFSNFLNPNAVKAFKGAIHNRVIQALKGLGAHKYIESIINAK